MNPYSGHCHTRTEIRTDWRGAHVVPACAHGASGPALCGLPVSDWLGQNSQQACAACLRAYRSNPCLTPSGPDHLLALFGIELGPSDPLDESVEDIEAAGDGPQNWATESLGMLNVHQSPDGAYHSDQWCASFSGSGEPQPLRLDSAGLITMDRDLHCRRGLPVEVEDSLFHALMVRDARSWLSRLTSMRGWNLYSAVTHHTFQLDPLFDYTMRPLEAQVTRRVREMHEMNHDLLQGVMKAAQGWIEEGWARRATNRQTAFTMMAKRELPPSTADLYGFHVHCDGEPHIIGLDLLTEAAVSPLSQFLPLLGEELRQRGLPRHCIEDVIDAVVTCERAITYHAESLVNGCPGRIITLTHEMPAQWTVWPHRQRDDGVSECWVPSALMPQEQGSVSGPIKEQVARALLEGNERE